LAISSITLETRQELSQPVIPASLAGCCRAHD
jgi:hypothetical protein